MAALSIMNYGPGLSPDAATYIAGARHLAVGEGYVGYAGDPVVRFPPAYSAAVALALTLGFDEIAAAGWLNVVFAAIAVLLSAYVISDVVETKTVRLLSFGLLVFSVPLLQVSTFVLSEAFFILLSVACLVMLTRNSSGYVVVAGILSGLATATRYIGVTVVATAAVWIWLANRGARFSRTMWFLGSAGLVVIPVIVRNLLLAGFGDHSSPANSLLTNMKVLVRSSERWFLPEMVPPALGAMILAPVAAYLLWRSIKQRVWNQIPLSYVGPFALFVGIYLPTLLALELLINIDPPTVRFLAPIYLPVVIVGSAGLDALVRAQHSQPIHRTATVLAVSLLLGGAALSIINSITADLVNGPGGYVSPEWRRSELVSLINAQRGGWEEPFEEIYSNDPWAAYLLNNLVVLSSASRTKRLSEEPGFPREAMCPDESERLLVWYEAAKSRTYLYTRSDIEQVCVVTPVLTAPDGVVAVLLPK